MYRSPEFMSFCINLYLWKLAKPSVDIHVFKFDRSYLFYYFCRSPKTISARTTLNSNQQFDWFELYDEPQESSRIK